jgi:REP element-mobilizing transposase RayT
MALFGDMRIAQILLDSLSFLIKAKRLNLHGYVIMENHVHLIVSGQNLSKQIGAFKSFTARSIIDSLQDEGHVLILRQLSWYRKRHKTDQMYQVWQEGSHPEMIQSEDMLSQKLDYIHFNPVRKGYVDDPAHWRYSSYRDYHGGIGLLPVHILGQDTETAEP